MEWKTINIKMFRTKRLNQQKIAVLMEYKIRKQQHFFRMQNIINNCDKMKIDPLLRDDSAFMKTILCFQSKVLSINLDVVNRIVYSHIISAI